MLKNFKGLLRLGCVWIACLAAAPLLAQGQSQGAGQGASSRVATPASKGGNSTATNGAGNALQAYVQALDDPRRSQAQRLAALKDAGQRAVQLARTQAAQKERFHAEVSRQAGLVLPASILARHAGAEAVLQEHWSKVDAAVRRLSDAAVTGKHDAARSAANELLQLEAAQNSRGASAAKRKPKPAWQSMAPGVAPWNLYERLQGGPRLFAATGTFSGLNLSEAADSVLPQQADLAPTNLTQANDALRAKANELGNNPVRISNWVRNTIAFTPGWGATRNAQSTLADGAGNAYDIANLLVALLRQAQVPARYVYGTVEVSAARIPEWMGVDAAAATQLLLKAGVPAQAVTQGGAIVALRFEHVWVEAWVPGIPSRGSVNASVAVAADTWWPIDASFKSTAASAGLDLKSLLSFNARGLLDLAKSGATCTNEYATNPNRDALAAAYASYRSAAQQHLAGLPADTRVGDVVGRLGIEQSNYPVLLDTQPYGVVARTTGLTDLPQALRWRVQLAVGNTALPGAAVLERDLADLQGRRLTLSFAPETADDATALNSFLAPGSTGALPSSIPAYLIRVKAQWRLDGQLVSEGGSFVLGEALELHSTLTGGNGSVAADSSADLMAGELHAWAVAGAGVGMGPLDAQLARLQALKSRLEAGSASAMPADDVAGEWASSLAQAYASAVDASAKLLARSSSVREHRLPTIVRASTRLQAETLQGIVMQVRPVGVALDIDRLGRAANPATAAAGQGLTAYHRQSFERASAAAHQLLEQLFGASNLVDAGGRSAVRDLARAAAAGQRVYLVDAANAAATVPQLNIGVAGQERITQAAGAGLRLLVPAASVPVDEQAALPVVAEDAAQAAGLYVTDDLAAPQPSASGRISGPSAGLGWLGLLPANVMGTVVQPHIPKLIASLNASRSIAGDVDGVLWSGFAGRDELIDAVFVASLNNSSTQTPCDWTTALLSTQLGHGLPALDRLNRSPVIQSLPVTHATQGQSYNYAVQAFDPDGQSLRYTLRAPVGAAVPTGMAINAAGVVSWASALPGQYALVVQVDDGQALAEQRFTLTVDALPSAPQLDVALSPTVANAGQTVTLQAMVSAGTGTGGATVSVTVDGQPLVLDASGRATFTAPASGTHIVRIVATSGGLTLAKEFVLTVRDASDADAPVALITSPVTDAEITRAVPVTGTASDSRFAYYQLLLRPAGAPDSAWVQLARGLSPVLNGTLGTLDPATLGNGTYELALSVVDVNGLSTTKVVTLEVARDLKLGQFRLSFADIRADASGLPLTLTRTYDSTQRSVMGDFGWGWRAAAQDVSVRKNMVLGLDWQVVARQLELCLVPTGQRRLTITLPDGGLYRFKARNRSECAFFAVPPVDIVFDPMPLPVGGGSGQGAGVAQLEVVLTAPVEARGGVLYDMDALGTWNPTDYRLTTPEGAIYYLREGVGIISVTDPYGNRVDYGPNGYQHSAGLGLQFTRDAQGRITRATDPAGRSLSYAYNAAGELASVTDRSGKVTRFDYASTTRQTTAGSAVNSHLLVKITNPDGQVIAQQQFDDYGRLTGAADALGQQATQSFDEQAGTLRLTNRRGFATTYSFDASGNVTRIVDAKGGVTELTYDANGNELTRRNPLGQVTTKTFDATTGTQTSETNALGQSTSTSYSAGAYPHERMNPTSTTDARGSTTAYAYVDEKQPGAVPTAITEPLGRSTAIGLDAKGNLKTLDVAGISTTYEYDAQGKRVKETDGTGATVTYTFDANGNELTRTVTRSVNGTPRTETTTRVYDADNRLTEETDATGAVTRTTYNSAGKPVTQTDALGRVTRYHYDANARLIQTEYPDGTSETTEYDANGNETARTDRLGRTTRMVYDELDRLTSTNYPDGTSTRTEYDAAGRVTASVDATGARSTQEYDAAGRQTAVVDASGRRTETQYDANGNRTSVTTAAGTAQARSTQFTYDALNRLTLTEYPDGSRHQISYRPDGRKASETDARGLTSTYGYDAKGQLTSVVQSGVPNATTYAYDQTGAKTTQTDALGRVVAWSFDAAGRPLSRTLPDGSTERFEYDAAGQLLARITFAGQRIPSTFDSAGRELTRIIPAGTSALGSTDARGLQFSYSADGQRLTHSETGPSSANGTTRYGYDAQGRLTSLQTPQGNLAWAYDAAGRITERSTSEGTTRYAYDGDGRLQTLTAPDSKQTTYSYDAAGRQIRSEQQFAAGAVLVTERRYDAADRQVAIAHSKRTGSGTASTTTLVAGQAITRGAGGAVSRIDTYDQTASFDASTGNFTGNPSRVQSFSYDANARLTSEKEYKGAAIAALLANPASAPTQATSYGYDAVGNRSTKTVTTPSGTESTTYAYDNNDRLTTETKITATGSAVTISYTWDGNGNLASRQTPSEFTGYLFDADNRLVEIKRGATPAAAATVVKYGYDADGQRIRKETQSGTTRYLIDPTTTWPQVALERFTSGTATEATAYVWGDQLRQQTRGGQGTLFGSPAEQLIPLQGHLGTTIAAIDLGGGSVERYEASAFGELATASPKLSHQYTGEYWDQDSRLTYLRARWYEPAIGGMPSIDPEMGQAGEPRTLNRHIYVIGDPLNNTDPTGGFTVSELNSSMEQIVNLSRSAAASFGQRSIRQGWTIIRELGNFAERRVAEIVTQCLKPKGPPKGLRIPDSRRRIDGLVQLEQGLFHWETKAGLPSVGSAALRRLKDQLLAYQRSGIADKLNLVFANKFTKEEMREVLIYLRKSGVETSQVNMFNGLIHFAAWIGSAYGTVCLGI